MASASYSTNSLNADENPVPLVFNSGAQYMVESPDMAEAHIVAKEMELLKQYENHQCKNLTTHPFWTVHTLLACDIQEKVQMAHEIKEALTLIRREQLQAFTCLT